MDTFKTTAKITKGGVLILNDLPFEENIEVEVTVQRQPEGFVRMEVDPNDSTLMCTHFRKSSESGFAGFYDLTGLGELYHGTVPILVIPKS